MNAIGGHRGDPISLPRAAGTGTRRPPVDPIRRQRTGSRTAATTTCWAPPTNTLTVKASTALAKTSATLYQIHCYRDGAAAAGILRAREFVIHFDIDVAGLKAAYHATGRPTSAYLTDFRCAMSSFGSVPGDGAEDAFIRAPQPCGQRRGKDHRPPGHPCHRWLPEAVVHDTGDTPTIASLVAWANEADPSRPP